MGRVVYLPCSSDPSSVQEYRDDGVVISSQLDSSTVQQDNEDPHTRSLAPAEVRKEAQTAF